MFEEEYTCDCAAADALQHCLASKGWKIIIADESHSLRTSEKPPDARHTEAAVSAVRRSRRAIFLTGTPSLSRPFDLFRQVTPTYTPHPSRHSPRAPTFPMSPAFVNSTQPVAALIWSESSGWGDPCNFPFRQCYIF